MMSSNEDAMRDVWGHPLEDDPQCENCGRSLIARFGGLTGMECESCLADFERQLEACGGQMEFVA